MLALLRNDKTLSQLRSLCVEQLEDFLADSTEGFVTRLFDALEGDLLVEIRHPARTTQQQARAGARDFEIGRGMMTCHLGWRL